MKYGLVESTTTTRGLAQTLARVKERAAVSGTTAFDDRFTVLIGEATEELEKEVSRAFITQTYRLYLDDFPISDLEPIRFPVAPAASVSSVTYVNTSGTTTTWSSTAYQTDFKQEPGRLLPSTVDSWPTVKEDTPNAVVVTFTAGYGSTAANVPDIAKKAIATSVVDTFQGCADGHEAEAYRCAVNLLK